MKKILGISVAVLMLVTDSASAHKLNMGHKLQNRSSVRSHQQGIFDKMIELATAEDKIGEEKHTATLRKEKQLADAEKEHDQAVKEEEEEEEKHEQEIEEQRQSAEQQEREKRQNDDHEALLKQLAEQTDAQLAQSVDLVELKEYTQNQLVNQDKKFNSKKASKGGLFANMEEKLQIHESMEQTKSALKAINKLSEHNNVQLDEQWKETPEASSPALILDSAAGQNIPKPVALYGLAQVKSSDISFGAHGYTMEPPKEKKLMLNVQKMADRLDVKLTPALLQLGSHEQISNAVIDQAVAQGKTQGQINDAMLVLKE